MKVVREIVAGLFTLVSLFFMAIAAIICPDITSAAIDGLKRGIGDKDAA